MDFPNVFPEGKDILRTIPKVEYKNLALKVSKILPGLLKKGQFHNQGTIQERTDKYIMSSNPLSNFIKEHCVRSMDGFIRYSELYTLYRRYLHNNKKRRISYREFNDVLALEGLWIVRTSKKIGDEFVNDRFIEGIELITVVQLVTDIPTHSLYKIKKVVGNGVTSHTTTIPLTETEPIFEPFNHKCTICGSNPSHTYNKKGEPLCEICFKAEQAQKVA